MNILLTNYVYSYRPTMPFQIINC